MKRWSLILIPIVLCFAHFPSRIVETEVNTDCTRGRHPSDRGVVIAPVGNTRAILGPQGKNIAVCQHGDVVAVAYGDPTPDPDNHMEVMIAYSLDSGASWTLYGPFSPQMRRVFPGLDGTPNFCTDPNELFFIWQESPAGYETGCLKWMVEQGTPAYPSFSAPGEFANSADIYPWLPCIAINPDDPLHIVATAWSYLNGNGWVYCWVSTDGGYTWTDTIPMCHIDLDAYCGHMRFGTGGYVLYTYGDLYDWHGTDIVYPYFIESTDGGYTWSAETPLPEVPVLDPAYSQFWWHDMDCEVIHNEPWIVHNDMNDVTPISADMWVFHGTGSPGSWAWDIVQVGDYEMYTTIADTAFVCSVKFYPSISYEPLLDVILISFKAKYFKGYPAASPTEIWYDGAHIGGIASQDSGVTWDVLAPLSDANTGQIVIGDWSATELAHRLVYIPNEGIYSYAVWVHEAELNAYFERGLLRYYLDENTPYGVETGPPINATIDINPDVLNLKSQGRWITCYIELPEGYSVEDIDVNAVALTAIDGEPIGSMYREGPVETGDYDKDGIPDLMAKFSRQSLIDSLSAMIQPPADVELTIQGVLADATSFEGSDTIHVIRPGFGPQTAEEGSLPNNFSLDENHPNPFGLNTAISYTLPTRALVRLNVYDVNGRVVKTIVSAEVDAGWHTALWDGKDEAGREVTSGVYFLRFKAGGYKQTRKVLLIR